MKLTTVTLPAVEIESHEAEYQLWLGYRNNFIEGKKIVHWMTDDGHNELRLDGEDFYRIVVIKPATLLDPKMAFVKQK